MNRVFATICLVCASAVSTTSAYAQAYGQERARAIGELTDGAIVETLQEEGRVSMSGGFFEFDSAELTRTSPEVLFKIARAMDTLKEMRLAIVGHTDSDGDAAFNQQLSERRANAVADVLLNQGVPFNRVQTFGRGESQPIASNFTPEGKAQNRRVEIVILPNA